MARLVLASALWALLALPVQAASMPMDQPLTLANNITTVCTGIAQSKDDPRWEAYPVRIEFANAANQYIADVHVTLRQGGNVLADLDCPGAWVLFQLPKGRYQITAERRDAPQAPPASATFVPPANGQKRVVLVFKAAK